MTQYPPLTVTGIDRLNLEQNSCSSRVRKPESFDAAISNLAVGVCAAVESRAYSKRQWQFFNGSTRSYNSSFS